MRVPPEERRAGRTTLVLLSSWNGASFIEEQIASILNQDVDGELRLLIRDDGSSDDTIAVIERFADPRIELTRGERLGAKASYLTLLELARRRDADFVALADQDDVWLPGKLQRAIAALDSVRGPALYASALMLVDEKLRLIRKHAFVEDISFENALFTNCVTGCTCVVNRSFLMLLEHLPAPDAILMHDWWLYLVAAAFGQVVYDTDSSILYRQHVSNQVGMPGGSAAALLHRIRRFLTRANQLSRLRQAREFQRLYGARLSEAHRKYLDHLVACENHARDRLRFAFAERPRRQKRLEDLICFSKFVVGAI